MVSAHLVADSVRVARPARSRPSPLRAVPGPTRLRLADLLHITDSTADDVLSGRYDHVVPAGGVPTDDRWFVRLHGDDEVDVWLISWVPGHRTELHDHGGSLGAATLLSGSLDEFRWDGERLRCRRLKAGDQAGFPLGWVHDVVWAPSGPAYFGDVAVRASGAVAECARLLAAVDRDVLLRGDRRTPVAAQAN